ncbi:protein phosphatase 2C domain-containing protein [Flavobacteriaceae bacterium]|nr:protein phosphatase 2C domain-containing protein [Flavobacteriaceae bacterium]
MFSKFLFLVSLTISIKLSAFNQEINENQIDSTSVNNITNLNTVNDTIKFSFRAGINNETEFDSIYNLILSNSNSIKQIHINGLNNLSYIYKDSLNKKVNISFKDSILNNLRYKVYDSIKVILNNSVGKLLFFKSEKTVKVDSIEQKKISVEEFDNDENNNAEGNTISFFKVLIISFGIIITLGIVFLIIRKFRKHQRLINSLKLSVSSLKHINKTFDDKIKKLNDENLQLKTVKKPEEKLHVKSEQEIIKIKDRVRKTSIDKNSLNRSELKGLVIELDNRWLTIAHSAIGKTHIQANPQIPCQDNNHFESVNDKWQIGIVCDGAGSSSMSHYGSELISKKCIPNNIKNELNNLEWFDKGNLPTKQEWNKLGISILKKTHDDLSSWVEQKNSQTGANHSIQDYASTVIVALYNSIGILILNIGDGRGGYLNKTGEFKGLFTPYSGEESNGTIFITSPIWSEPQKFIQTDVINDDIISVFLLTDGMEKITFECSNLTDDVFIDVNIPYKKFFLPILSKIKSLSKKEEIKLIDEWKAFIESGNDAIENEGDDKTLLISILK